MLLVSGGRLAGNAGKVELKVPIDPVTDMGPDDLRSFGAGAAGRKIEGFGVTGRGKTHRFDDFIRPVARE